MYPGLIYLLQHSPNWLPVFLSFLHKIQIHYPTRANIPAADLWMFHHLMLLHPYPSIYLFPKLFSCVFFQMFGIARSLNSDLQSGGGGRVLFNTT